MTKPYYITTAIDYSNGDPHLGHALEKVGADAIARWQRLNGRPVYFMMGMDENAQKVIQAAELAGSSPQAWLDAMSARFNACWHQLECSHDDWMRTTDERHTQTVQSLIELIQSRSPSDLFAGEYEGLYCVGCEEFKSESQIANGRCIEHPSRELVPTKERNTFFRLSAYGDKILAAIDSGAFKVEPEIRRNEVVRVIQDGLQDISISRGRLPWGIPFPGSPDETVYVWFDALINYYSAAMQPVAGFEPIWPADLHVVGKGITRFHCIIWPAMLMSAGIELPREVWAHGYVQWGGAKVSKSEGTGVSVDEAIARYGPDALRWFLLREVGFENDGDFSMERFDARYEGDLANGLGNLAARVTAMIEKYRDGVVPADTTEEALDVAGIACTADYSAAMDAIDLKGGAENVSRLVTEANGYIVANAPWVLAKQGDDARLDSVLAALARCLLRLSVMTSPFMPGKARALWAALGQSGTPEAAWKMALEPELGGVKVSKPENLFQRVERT